MYIKLYCKYMLVNSLHIIKQQIYINKRISVFYPLFDIGHWEIDFIASALLRL